MTKNKYEHVIRAFHGTPWAILPEKLDVMSALLELRATGGVVSEETMQAAISAARPREAKSSGSVAIIPIYGVIGPRMSLFMYYSGGTSIDQLTADYRAALSNDDVKAIIFDIDSPGGSVTGVHELANEILANRGQKKTVAVSNGMMASAAYYIGCCADEVVSSPSSLTGSIGVLTYHEDISKAEDMAGIKTTLISAGKYKVEGNEHEPLSDDARAATQSLIDSYYDMFVQTVAKARGVSASDVKTGLGEGRVLGAKAAVSAGLVDKIATLDQTLARFGATDPRKRPSAVTATSGVSAGPEAGAESGLCECSCGPCVGGNCVDCSHDPCDCAGCTCDGAEEDDTDDTDDDVDAKKKASAIRDRELALLN